MTISRFFKKSISSITPYLGEFVEKFGPHTLKEFWLSEELVRLMTNENLFGPSDKVKQAIKNYVENIYKYPEPTCIELREKLGEYTGFKAENIFLAPGSVAILDMIFRGVLNPGDKVVLSLPYYDPYILRMKLIPAEPVYIKVDLDTLTRNIDEVVGKIDDRTKIAILMHPHNPLGIPLKWSEIEPLLEKDIILIIDEAYYEFCSKTYSNLIKEYDKVIIVRTMSKAFGIADLRVGYAIASQEMVEYLEKIALPFQIPTIVAVGAKAALEDLNYMKKTTATIIKEREKLFKVLRSFPQLEPIPSCANFILVRVIEDGLKASDIANALLDDGIAVREMKGREGLDGEYFRVSVGKPEHNKIFLEKLENILK